MSAYSYSKVEVRIHPGGSIYDDALASGAITPGQLCEMTNAANDTVKRHATAGGTVKGVLIAVNDPTYEPAAGVTVNAIDKDYDDGDRVQLRWFQSGEQAFMLLADGENATKGGLGESNGNGDLRVVDADASAGAIAVGSVKFRFDEAVDLSGSSGADPATRRVLVTII